MRYVDAEGHLPLVPLLIAGAVALLKVADYAWTAWDAYTSLRILAHPQAPEAEKLVAALNLALSAGAEAAEPDEAFPIPLPLDDLGRRALVAGFHAELQRGGLPAGIRFLRQATGPAAPQLVRKLYNLGMFRDIKPAREWQAL